MFFVSHICLPIVAVNICNIAGVKFKKKIFVEGKDVLWIGLLGAVPDIVNPHIYLADRYNSWSHTVWFVSGVAIILVMLKYCKFVSDYCFVVGGVFAVVLHIVCDGITGGVKPFWPCDVLWGKYLIGSNHWIELDVISFLSAVTTWYLTNLQIKRSLNN